MGQTAQRFHILLPSAVLVLCTYIYSSQTSKYSLYCFPRYVPALLEQVFTMTNQEQVVPKQAVLSGVENLVCSIQVHIF